ncbi:MAG TPA: serine/threonine-protein kinase, partial [Bryobacteraceae bacterium]
MEKRVLHYELVEQLGFGGAGEVYKATDTRLGRAVALKFINHTHGASKRIGDMLIAEARTASRLDHANIGTIFEIGRTDDGRPFIAMAYYEGKTLQHLIRSGPMPMEQATGYARQMAEGLAYAHAHDVVHRDIKPSNVIVTAGGVLKIIDFGLARAAQDPEVTMTLGLQGTPAYMSPEQATGLPATHLSDVWAWGLVLYEMLTGAQPFSSQNLQATLYAVIHKPIEPLATL